MVQQSRLIPTNDTQSAVLVEVVSGSTGEGGAGDASAANQLTEIARAEEIRDRLGATNESAASSDTATSGLNGLFKRLLIRFTELLNLLGSITDTASAAGSVMAKLRAIVNSTTWSAIALNSSSGSHTSFNASNKFFTVPSAKEWQLISIYTELTTSSTAGNRQLTVRLEDSSGNVFGRYPVGAIQTASLTRRYNHAVGLPDLEAFRDIDKLETPLPPAILPAGYRFRILDSGERDTTGDSMTVRALVMEKNV